MNVSKWCYALGIQYRRTNMEYSVIGIIIFIAYICFVVWAYFKEEAEKNTSPITDTSSFDLKDLEGLDTLLRGCQIQANASYDSVNILKRRKIGCCFLMLWLTVSSVLV